MRLNRKRRKLVIFPPMEEQIYTFFRASSLKIQSNIVIKTAVTNCLVIALRCRKKIRLVFENMASSCSSE